MAKFRRKLNDRQRAAMIRRKQAMAAKVAAKPRAEVVCEATATRSAGKNTVILRTHRKEGRVSKLTAASVRSIGKSAESLRQKVLQGDQSAIPKLMDKLGKGLADAVTSKIASGDIGHQTGQLLSSIAHRVKNA